MNNPSQITKEQPEPVLPKATPSLKAMMQALDAFYAEEEVPERGMLSAFRILLDDTCRAAMLQGKAEPVSQPYKLPPNSFTNDDLEMMSHGDNPQANAYRELLALRRKSLVIPEGWIAVSERMPEMHTPVWCFGSITAVSGKEFGFEGWLTTGGFVAENNSSSPGGCEKAIVTHWMPLPAAPQQEVQSQVQEQRASIREEMAMGSRLTNQRFRVK